jgi:BirA family biotin operon repressor/biotin-[acetyl-CoA-carboxylase] ligase
MDAEIIDSSLNVEITSKPASVGVVEKEKLSPSLKSLLTFDIKSFEAIDSTSAHAKRLAVEGAPEGTVVFALDQAKAYGRYGREWLSHKGNLYFSLILRPNIDIRKLCQVSFVTALAVGRVIRALFPENPEKVTYKWPNDILVDEKKVAGILLETSLMSSKKSADWLVIGVGINTVYHPTKGTTHPAFSLVDAGADPTTEKKMLKAILAEFDTLYAQWQEHGFAAIRKEWLEGAAFKDKKIQANTAKETYQGIFRDLNPAGELVLELEDGRKRLISTGEIFFSCDHARV